MKLAIVGYGNLGKSLEKEIIGRDDLELTAIYSRRTLDNALYRPINDVKKANCDILMLALGSYTDIINYADKFTNYHTVDSFDTHSKITEYKEHLKHIKPNKLSIISTGWDPGLLSMARGIFGADKTTYATVWGEGVSQGHSNAIRTIDGVIDAIQFTTPKKDYETLIDSNIYDSALLHRRVCYVAAVESDKQRIEKEIKTMPSYFADYETEVNFVTPQEVRALKQRTGHSGQVFVNGRGYSAKTEVAMQSNADFTAQIMLRYAAAIPQLLKDGYTGALDVFDIPLKYIADSILI